MKKLLLMAATFAAIIASGQAVKKKVTQKVTVKETTDTLAASVPIGKYFIFKYPGGTFEINKPVPPMDTFLHSRDYTFLIDAVNDAQRLKKTLMVDDSILAYNKGADNVINGDLRIVGNTPKAKILCTFPNDATGELYALKLGTGIHEIRDINFVCTNQNLDEAKNPLFSAIQTDQVSQIKWKNYFIGCSFDTVFRYDYQSSLGGVYDPATDSVLYMAESSFKNCVIRSTYSNIMVYAQDGVACKSLVMDSCTIGTGRSHNIYVHPINVRMRHVIGLGTGPVGHVLNMYYTKLQKGKPRFIEVDDCHSGKGDPGAGMWQFNNNWVSDSGLTPSATVYIKNSSFATYDQKADNYFVTNSTFWNQGAGVNFTNGYFSAIKGDLGILGKATVSSCNLNSLTLAPASSVTVNKSSIGNVDAYQGAGSFVGCRLANFSIYGESRYLINDCDFEKGWYGAIRCIKASTESVRFKGKTWPVISL